MATQEWAPIIAALTAGESLDYGQSYWLMDQVMSGELGEARLASFLTAMAIKGATVDEIHGLADGMQDHAAHVELPSRALDIVGTGGDGYKTVNISTMSAIVLAAMGIPLVKHGNRASTSKSGSADVIEALGVNLDLDADALRRVFDEVGIAFLFANRMHPSMRFAAPVRRALGFPTAFNVLGPLTNPARVQACAIGASREENARLIGMATGAIFYALMTLISLTTVAAFDAVGSILVISFFIAPAAAALLFTKRLHHALFLAVSFGVLGSAIGYGLALHFNASMAGMCALVNMLIYVVAVFVYPKGVITRRLKRMRRKARLKEELLIIHLGTHTAENLYSEENAVRDIAEHLRWSEREMRRVSERLKEAGIVRRSGGYYLLTEKGVERYRALCEEYVI